MKTTGLWMNGDDLIERHSEDVEPVLEHAKALRSCGMVGSSEMRLAAEFPASVVELYKQKAGITHHEFVVNPVHIRRMLNDPDL
jgi:hypothetical protein